MVHDLAVPSPRVRRKRTARRREILSAALGLVESRGLDGLTIKLVAEELDYTVGALYRYFPSKSALVGALQRETVERIDALHGECIALCSELTDSAGKDSAWAALAPAVATVSLYSGYALRSPGPFGLLSISLGDPRHLIDDDDARAVLDAAAPIFARIGESLDRAVAEGALEPGDGMDRAILLWASLHGVVQLAKLRRVGSERIDTDRLTPHLVEGLLCGWGAAPEAVRESHAQVGNAEIVERVLGRDQQEPSAGGEPSARNEPSARQEDRRKT
jgi:AcrR family transcriptional regulator